jgi:hypothetical protein
MITTKGEDISPNSHQAKSVRGKLDTVYNEKVAKELSA